MFSQNTNVCFSFQANSDLARRLRAAVSVSTAFRRFLAFLVGTRSIATAPTCGATCSRFLTTSCACLRCTAAYGESGPSDQTGNAKARQDLL